MADQKVGVLACKDVVRHDAEAVRVAQRAAQLQQQRGLSAADGSANADREAAGAVVAAARRLALMEQARMMVMFVRMRMRDVVHKAPAGSVQPFPPTLFSDPSLRPFPPTPPTTETDVNTDDRGSIATDR